MNLLILDAGKGSRLYSQIKNNKCLIKVNKEQSLLTKIINDSKKAGIKKIFIVVGFNKEKIKNKLKKYKDIKFIYNKNYNKTDMVFSMMLGLKYINDDTIVTYSDIFYDQKVLNKLLKVSKQKIILPIKKNWEEVWTVRDKLTINDAEHLIVKRNKIFQIGKKIKKNENSKYQFMGLIYFPQNLLKSLIFFYNLLKNQKIQTTNFLNFLIKKKINIHPLILSNYWYEFDDSDDIDNFNNYAKIKKIKQNYYI